MTKKSSVKYEDREAEDRTAALLFRGKKEELLSALSRRKIDHRISLLPLGAPLALPNSSQ